MNTTTTTRSHNMITCTREQHHPTEFQPHKFCVEASDLGIAPGATLPGAIETDLGNAQPLILREVTEHGAGVYRQHCGCIELHVIND